MCLRVLVGIFEYFPITQNAVDWKRVYDFLTVFLQRSNPEDGTLQQAIK